MLLEDIRALCMCANRQSWSFARSQSKSVKSCLNSLDITLTRHIHTHEMHFFWIEQQQKQQYRIWIAHSPTCCQHTSKCLFIWLFCSALVIFFSCFSRLFLHFFLPFNCRQILYHNTLTRLICTFICAFLCVREFLSLFLYHCLHSISFFACVQISSFQMVSQKKNFFVNTQWTFLLWP